MQKLKTLNKRVNVYVADSLLCKGKGLFSAKSFQKEELVYEFEGEYIKGDLSNISNPYVLQLDIGLYFLPFNEGKYLNHSCEPNCKIVWENNRVLLIAIKDIKRDEELSYNYNTTEFEMGPDWFICSCGSNSCYKVIKGFKYLSKEQKYKIKDLILPYLYKFL